METGLVSEKTYTRDETTLIRQYRIDLAHNEINGSRVTELSPAACPAGHQWGPGRSLRGWRACLCTPDKTGHRLWICTAPGCGAAWLWPSCRQQPDVGTPWAGRPQPIRAAP